MTVLGMFAQNYAKLLAVVLCVATVCYADDAFGEEDKRLFDVEAFDERRSQAPVVTVTPGQITEQQRELKRAEAAQDVERFGQAFRLDEQKWKAETQMMRREMEKVLQLARRDRAVLAWASALDFLGSLAISYAEFRAYQDAQSNSGKETTGEPDTAAQGVGNDLNVPKKPHYRINQEGRQTIEWCSSDGKDCELIEYNELMRSLIVPDSSKAAPGKDRSELDEDFLREGSDVLGALPGSLRCLEAERSCYTVSEGVASETVGIREDSDNSAAAGAQLDVAEEGFGQFQLNLREGNGGGDEVGKRVFSFLADVLPGVGTVKGGIEALTGRDPVTGEEVNRIVAATGFVASVVPGGRVYVKSAVSGGKLALKYAKIKLRHYTSRKGSKGILKEGVIRAGKYGKIHAESANRRLLSPSDAAERYGLRSNRGQDAVEFSPQEGQQWYTRKNPNTGVDEIVVEGNVQLGPGSKVFQRD